MKNFVHSVSGRLALMARVLVTWILAGLSPNLKPSDVEWQLSQRAPREQTALVTCVLLTLGFLTLVFGQAGWGGIVAFWAALLFVMRSPAPKGPKLVREILLLRRTSRNYRRGSPRA